MRPEIAAGGQKLKPNELALFCTQVSLFLRAGISLIEGLELLCEDIEDKKFKGIIISVIQSVDNRMAFSDALAKSGAFPDYLVRMTRIGEVSGNLDDTFEAMARFYERDAALRQRIRSAVTYPVLLILMMSGVVLLLIVQVLPMFEDLLSSLGGEMPGIVRGLIAVGNFIGNNIFVIGCVVVLAILLYNAYNRSSEGHKNIDRFKAKFVLTKNVSRTIAAERFATAMSFLLKASVDMEIAMSLSRDIVGNEYLANKIDKALVRVEAGEPPYEAINKAGIFPRLFTRMLGIGHKTGDMDTMMARLAGIYEQQVDETLGKITGSIEPIFVALLSVIVGIILISVMLPLIRIMSSIG